MLAWDGWFLATGVGLSGLVGFTGVFANSYHLWMKYCSN